MQFKIDENLPKEGADLLREAGHQAETVYAEGLQGTSDRHLVAACQQEGRILVTLDRGFGNLITYPLQQYPGLIILHPHRQDKPTILTLLQQLIPLFATTPLVHHLWVVEEGRVRIRGGED